MEKANKESDEKAELRIAHTAVPDPSSGTWGNQSEKHKNIYPVLEEFSSELCLVIEASGEIIYGNRAANKLLSYDAKTLTGTSVHSLIPIEQAMVFRAGLRASSEEGDSPILIDCQLINRDGKKTYYRLSIRDLRNHPHIEGYLIHATNIVRLKYQEQKLKISQAILAMQDEAMILVDWKNKKIEYANAAFMALSGFSKSDLFGGKLNVFQSPYNQFLFAEGTSFKEMAKFKSCIKRHKVFNGKVYSKRKNGTLFYNRIRVTPIFDHGEEPSQYLMTVKAIKSRS